MCAFNSPTAVPLSIGGQGAGLPSALLQVDGLPATGRTVLDGGTRTASGVTLDFTATLQGLIEPAASGFAKPAQPGIAEASTPNQPLRPEPASPAGEISAASILEPRDAAPVQTGQITAASLDAPATIAPVHAGPPRKARIADPETKDPEPAEPSPVVLPAALAAAPQAQQQFLQSADNRHPSEPAGAAHSPISMCQTEADQQLGPATIVPGEGGPSGPVAEQSTPKLHPLALDGSPIRGSEQVHRAPADDPASAKAAAAIAMPLVSQPSAPSVHDRTTSTSDPGGNLASSALPTTTSAQILPVVVRLTASDSTRRISLQLTPHELGRVDVHVEQTKAGLVAITLTFERAGTLDLMQHDQTQLLNALDQAGLTGPERTVTFHLDPAQTNQAGTPAPAHASIHPTTSNGSEMALQTPGNAATGDPVSQGSGGMRQDRDSGHSRGGSARNAFSQIAAGNVPESDWISTAAPTPDFRVARPGLNITA